MKIYRCCRCNAELKNGEAYVSRERTVTHQSFNSGRDYKVKAFPRYHADESICERIRNPNNGESK
jgi:hypothetical protein